MDSDLLAALIGGGATIVAAIITVVFINRARHPQATLPPPEDAAPALRRRRRAPARPPSAFWLGLRGYFARLWDDPVHTISESLAKTLAVLITLAVAVMTIGAIAYGLWQAVKGTMRW